MKYVLIGKDATDEKALDRRMANRQEHLDHLKPFVQNGIIEYAIAIKDDSSKPIGSVLVFECDTKQYIQDWLNEEPYVNGNVWETIEIYEGAIPQFE